jgi:thiol-disulfide isomerase/thioredoxin
MPGSAKKLTDMEEDSKTYWDSRLRPGAQPFAFKATDIKGNPVTIAQYKGKVLMLDFWATWCGPCVGEIPNVLAVYKKYHTKGFDVVGISLDNDKSALTNFLKEKKIPYRQIFNGKGWSDPIARQYGVRGIPFMLLIGKTGNIVAVDPRGDALEPAVRHALALD